MKKTFVTTLLLSLIAAPTFAQSIDERSLYWSDSWRGWHFYEVPAPDPDPYAPLPPVAAPSQTDVLRDFTRLQKAVENTRNIAIMRPTEANVQRYMELEAQVVARASYFADVAQRVAWTHPELDPTLQGRPVCAVADQVVTALAVGTCRVRGTQAGDYQFSPARARTLVIEVRP